MSYHIVVSSEPKLRKSICKSSDTYENVEKAIEQVKPAGIDANSGLEAADPAAGSITINNLFYEWEDFEVIVCNLNIGPQVPTLSEWGLIAMAGILGIVGIVGFIVIRRRKAVA